MWVYNHYVFMLRYPKVYTLGISGNWQASSSPPHTSISYYYYLYCSSGRMCFEKNAMTIMASSTAIGIGTTIPPLFFTPLLASSSSSSSISTRLPPQILHLTLHHHHRLPKTLIRSIDVSKEDKQEQEQPQTQAPTEEPASESPEESPLDKRRLEEKFAVVNTGIYECRSCGYRYDESAGDPSYPIPPGLPFDRLPEDWRCATCGASKTFFESKRVEIAGFAQNQQYGFGGNSLTSGQKALLIYGSLLLGFILFLSGYFIQ